MSDLVKFILIQRILIYNFTISYDTYLEILMIKICVNIRVKI